jgi:predicted AlkP superfamily phosphohydrolase/phosphomutase
VNDWLRQEGYLVLKKDPPARGTALLKCEVDWSRTRAWAEGGYYARIFLNVRGREPQGLVDPREFERVRGDLGHHLAQITDDRGNPLRTVSHVPQRLYPKVEGIAPDLITIFGELHWRAAGTLGWNAVHLLENDTGPDEANHAQNGYFNLVVPGQPAVAENRTLDILDVAPTLLQALQIPIPVKMQGRPFEFAELRIEEAVVTAESAETAAAASDGYSGAEAQEIEKRLEALGYLG